MKFNKQQWEWIFYDWANSGYAMLVTTAVFPIYFKVVALQGGISSADSTAYWGYANSFSTLIIALLAPLLGALADYPHAKRRWLNIFTWLGIVTAMILGSLPANGTMAWLWLIIVYVISNMGYSGSNLFYDSFLTDVADDEQMDEVSSAGFGFGYLGGVLSFAVFLVAELTNGFGILDGNGVARFSFWLSAGWWLLFAWPLMKNGQQRYGVPDTENRIANSWQRVLQTLRHINHYRQAFWFLVAYFFFIDGVDTIVTMATVIGEDLGIKTTTLMIVMLVVQLIAAPFSMLYAWLAKKTSTRRALLLSIIVYMLICLYALKLKSAADFWVLAIGRNQSRRHSGTEPFLFWPFDSQKRQQRVLWLLQHSGQVFGNSGTGFGWTGYAMDRQLTLGNLFFGDSFCDRSGHLFDSATPERC